MHVKQKELINKVMIGLIVELMKAKDEGKGGKRCKK